MTVLHVTNGDSTVARLRDAGVTNQIVPWCDVPHLGPFAPTEPLREVRAAYLASVGLASVDEALAGFVARDAALADHDGEVRLWFEADLYDQLQLIEILSRLDGRRVELVCIGEFPGIAHFWRPRGATGRRPRGVVGPTGERGGADPVGSGVVAVPVGFPARLGRPAALTGAALFSARRSTGWPADSSPCQASCHTLRQLP